VRAPERTTIAVLGPAQASAADPQEASQLALQLVEHPHRRALAARLIEEAMP
jgi:hypothetical protein